MALSLFFVAFFEHFPYQESLENKKSMEEFSADFLDLDIGEEKAK